MKKNFLFLGFAIPDKEMERNFEIDKFPAIQTHKFIWNMIKGLETCDKFEFTYISAKPVSDYPLFPHRWINGGKRITNVLNKEIELQEISFYNTSIAKIVTRFFSGLYNCFKKYHKKINKGGVIVYSVHVPFMLVGYIISKIYRIEYIGIWTDPPAISNNRERLIKSKLRNIEYHISKYLMKNASKVIVLAGRLAEDFAPGKPYLIIDGIIDENEIYSEIRNIKKNETDFIKVVYTGSLEKRYGMKNLIDSFILLKNEKILFDIYGRGDYQEDLKTICLLNENIRYKGFVSNIESLKIQREADFLINARSAAEEFTKYSFPSKLLEYMLSGTPVITTMSEAIPDEYRNYLLVLEDNCVETICEMLHKIIGIKKEDRRIIGIEAQNFVRKNNYIDQGIRIINFLS